MIKIICLFSIVFLSLSCSKSHEGMLKATIKDFTGLDGCGMVIVLENGENLEPVNLNSFSTDVSINDGQKVWIKYHEVSYMSICMVGPMIEIDALEER